jgi:murein DD-endopeptidase MepM/ murein hydrolase activator NlpD
MRKKYYYLLSILLVLFPIKIYSLSITVTLDPPVVKQGNTLVVNVEAIQPLKSLVVSFRGKDQTFYPLDEKGMSYRGIVGIPMDMPPPYKTIYFLATDMQGETVRVKRKVQIQATAFKKAFLNIKPAKMKLLDTVTLMKESSLLGAIFKKQDPKKRWQDTFIMPADGRISAMFGEKRVYTGGSTWQHKGMDVTNVEGTPVKAVNNGVVKLAGKLSAHGGTIMIDHGQGVISVYNHMQTIKVKKGDYVKKGKVVGTMGQTGLATGVNLHWGLSVGNVRVDPLEWVHRPIE